MSKKSGNRNEPPKPAAAPAEKPVATRFIVLGAGAAVLVLVALMAFILQPKGATARSDAELGALHRPHAATIGDPAAKVEIVEFLDPACSTCREFYPLVKALMRDNPGRMRLAIRMVAFHPNSDVAVKALEAAKRQDKFWVVLEHLLKTQPRWVIQHRVDPDALWAELGAMDLDFAKLQQDMASPEVARSLALDTQDSKTLKVTATPEYFVNGRGLPEFGYEPLRRLVADEIARAYR
jgi:protein-disulfide isomerase